MNSKKIVSIVIAFVAVIVAVATLSAGADRNSAPESAFAPLAGDLVSVESPTLSDKVVEVGLYGTNVYELSFENNTFYFSGYIWMRWSGDIDPVSTLEFVNAVETWGMMITPLSDEPIALENGQFAQTLSVQGRFYKAFELNNYPLDSQTLTIMLEDSSNTVDSIVYRVDSTQSGVDPNMSVHGFDVNGISAQNFEHSYGTDFGATGTAAEQIYSALEFRIHIDRNPNLFLWKLLFPLLLVLVTNWLTLLMSPRYVEVRTAMPATALLTTVFLQLSAMESVSQASVLVLMDQIYLVAYAAIVTTLAQVIWGNRTIKDGDDNSVAVVATRDKRSLAIQSVITIGIFIALIVPKLI